MTTARLAAHRAAHVLVFAALVPLGGCTALAVSPRTSAESPVRQDAVARARVWRHTDIPQMDLRYGPRGKGSFAPGAVVECRYEQRESSGNTPKFMCVRPNGDVVKVKYGADNGEVYAEVAATRLLWALGFGADHMYPVSVRCLGCPDEPDGPPRPGTVRLYETAAIERKMPGRDIGDADSGWSWPELDAVSHERGGASVAERDALKLLAVVLQHTDSKREQQRLICLDDTDKRATCRRPFMLVSDLGKTFGKANAFNRDAPGSVNLKAWAAAPVWADATGCRASLGRSLTGTLESPVVTDAGRRFLVGLLRQLSDQQVHDMFAVARFPLRARMAGSTDGDIDAWVAAFKVKVAQIAGRSCLPTGGAS